MSRQQDKVLRAMISLRQFTAADLHEYSGVPPATIRTVIKRFGSAIETLSRVPTGERGGQYCSYKIRAERVGQLIDKVLEFTPSEGSQVDEERRRLLDLSVAHGSLVGIFGSGATTDEIRQLLDLVASDIAIARRHLAEMPADDPQFAHYARRIEEVNSLYQERRSLIQGSAETEMEIRRLGEAVDETNAFGCNIEERQRATFVLVDVDFSPIRRAWSSTFCHDLDASTTARTKLVRNASELYRLRWEDELIAGCIMAVDSSAETSDSVVPVVEYLQELPRLMPVLIVDAHQNSDFQHTVMMRRCFYTSGDLYRYSNDAVDARAVFRYFSNLVQSLWIAHRLVSDRTCEAARSVAKVAEGGSEAWHRLHLK
jgi:hypothetical protein